MGKLIYILSFGHSGSTLLDLTLGTHPEMLSTGELMFLPFNLQRSLNAEYPIADGSRCSCHLKYLDCPVWSETINRMVSKTGDMSIRDNPLLGFDMSFLRDQDFFARGRLLDRIRKCLILRSPKRAGALFEKSTSQINNWAVIDELCDVSGKGYVIDSSKDIFRLIHLNRVRPNDVKVIVNIRTPFGVANSYLKLGRSVEAATKPWLKYYKSIARIIEQLGLDVSLVDYSTLCAQPIAVRRKLLRHLELSDDSPEEIVIRRGGHHMALGNGMRFNEKITIREDTGWRGQLSNKDKSKVDRYLSDRIKALSPLLSRKQLEGFMMGGDNG